MSFETPQLLHVGTAGWSIPPAFAASFPGEGSHLQRYADRLSAVEINSTFRRSHRPLTFARWAASVPETFRFSIKVPQLVTHERRLVDASAPMQQLLDELALLGPKVGPLLVQLPPSAAFDARVVRRFFSELAACAPMTPTTPTTIVCEPRHPSWFTPAAERLLMKLRVARVAADPAPVPGAERPGGWPGLVYYRLHGSPRRYYSAYTAAQLDDVAAQLRVHLAAGIPAWCIFDNTVLGAATANALALRERLEPSIVA